jgi:hypothetical protein
VKLLNDSDSFRLRGAIAMMQERLGMGGRGVAVEWGELDGGDFDAGGSKCRC